MSAPTRLALLVGLCAWAPGPVTAQRTWQADLRIQSIEIVPVGQGSLSLRVQVTSGEQATAQESRLEILVPVGVEVVRVSAGCRAGTLALPAAAGRVTCDLGDVPVRGLREVTLTTSRPPAGSRARVAAFVMSSTPDPIPTNNFAERSAQ
ncbi:MAG: hypothetical protein AB7R55_02230 [Gemmatimonadales bacterium]